MQLFRDAFERRSDGASTTLDRPAAWLLDAFGGGRTASGERITPTTAEGLPVVYACKQILAESVGMLPLKLLRRTPNGGKQPDTVNPLYTVLHDLANPEMTAAEFRETIMGQWVLWGNGYAEIIRDRHGRVQELWPLLSERMLVDRNSAGRLRYRYWLWDGGVREWTYDPMRPPIFHLRINALDGIHGRSPLTVLRESLGITRAAERMAGSFFGDGAMPGVILTHPSRLKPEAKQNLRESWRQKFNRGEGGRSNDVAILTEGVKFEKVTIPPNDAQFLETRAFQIEDGSRIYRIPLFLLNHMTKNTSWGTGIEQLGLAFVNYTLMPWLVKWMQAIARDLLTVRQFNTHTAQFVVNALVRGDIKSRYEAYARGRQNGWLTANQILKNEDEELLSPDVGDTIWMPVNMTVAGTPPEAPAPPPDAVPGTQPVEPGIEPAAVVVPSDSELAGVE